MNIHYILGLSQKEKPLQMSGFGVFDKILFSEQQ
jgi:hypothetical protein